jgi:hypothetical protein
MSTGECIARQCRGHRLNRSAARSGSRPEALSLDKGAPALPPLLFKSGFFFAVAGF